jgi:carboxylesterase type B
MVKFQGVFLFFILAYTTLVGSPTVSLSGQGIIAGTVATWRSSAPTVNKWLGIPYAQSPPVMFQRAVPPKPWEGIKQTTSYSDACYQNFGKPGKFRDAAKAIYNNPPNGPVPIESTDCLYITVFTPANATIESKLSVLFWIYGGGLQGGSVGITYYDGTSFVANQGIILVSFNYRTNIFGQSNSPAIKVENNNVGLWDQVTSRVFNSLLMLITRT